MQNHKDIKEVATLEKVPGGKIIITPNRPKAGASIEKRRQMESEFWNARFSHETFDEIMEHLSSN